MGGTDTQHETLTVTFGPDGLVKDFTSSIGASDMSTGLSSASKADTKEVDQKKRPK